MDKDCSGCRSKHDWQIGLLQNAAPYLQWRLAGLSRWTAVTWLERQSGHESFVRPFTASEDVGGQAPAPDSKPGKDRTLHGSVAAPNCTPKVIPDGSLKCGRINAAE
jgi:hypothetical protein